MPRQRISFIPPVQTVLTDEEARNLTSCSVNASIEIERHRSIVQRSTEQGLIMDRRSARVGLAERLRGASSGWQS